MCLIGFVFKKLVGKFSMLMQRVQQYNDSEMFLHHSNYLNLKAIIIHYWQFFFDNRFKLFSVRCGVCCRKGTGGQF
jgi:hypothetical protein